MSALFSDPLTISYGLRNLLARRMQAALTVGGIALVVFVFTAALMLAEGLRQTLAATGSPDNLIVIRSGAENEVQSAISRDHAAIISTEAKQDETGKQLAASDVLVLVSLKKRADAQPSNVNVRGTSFETALRSGVRIVEGRAFQPGTKEIIVGSAINRKFAGTDVGQTIRLVGADWPITGVFDAGNSGFSSEIWGDVDVLMPAFRHEAFSSVTFRPAAGIEETKKRLEDDRRLTVSVMQEDKFYESQSRILASFIKIIGGFVSAVFSIGAIIGAMITMYSSVSNRVREIGILRALGFTRLTIFSAFLKECLLLGLAGGVLGLFAAALLSFVTFSTTNFNSFSELSFGFSVTPQIAAASIIFSLVMGLIGGALPAYRAGRLSITTALRRH